MKSIVFPNFTSVRRIYDKHNCYVYTGNSTFVVEETHVDRSAICHLRLSIHSSKSHHVIDLYSSVGIIRPTLFAPLNSLIGHAKSEAMADHSDDTISLNPTDPKTFYLFILFTGSVSY
jgi:hypothetical protein